MGRWTHVPVTGRDVLSFGLCCFLAAMIVQVVEPALPSVVPVGESDPGLVTILY